jgi:outer membrane protein insertion porin family
MGFPSSEFSQFLVNYGLRFDNLELTTTAFYTEGADGTPRLGNSVELVDPTDFDVIRAPSTTAAGDPVAGLLRTDRCNLSSLQRDINCERNGEFITSQIGYTWAMDKTNDPIIPSSGYDLNVSQSLAGLGGDVNFHRTTLRGSYYQRLPLRLIGSLKLNAGYIDSFNDDGVRTNDRFFLGGNRGFRGFDVAGVGPRLFGATSTGRLATRGQALGARAYAITTAEALLPLPLPPSYGIRASLFVDAGYVGLTNDRDRELFNTPGSEGCYFDTPQEILPLCPQFNSGPVVPEIEPFLQDPLQDDFAPRVVGGLSVNWNSPFGPVQIDLSEAFVAEDYDRPQSFRFSAGGRF